MQNIEQTEYVPDQAYTIKLIQKYLQIQRKYNPNEYSIAENEAVWHSGGVCHGIATLWMYDKLSKSKDIFNKIDKINEYTVENLEEKLLAFSDNVELNNKDKLKFKNNNLVRDFESIISWVKLLMEGKASYGLSELFDQNILKAINLIKEDNIDIKENIDYFGFVFKKEELEQFLKLMFENNSDVAAAISVPGHAMQLFYENEKYKLYNPNSTNKLERTKGFDTIQKLVEKIESEQNSADITGYHMRDKSKYPEEDYNNIFFGFNVFTGANSTNADFSKAIKYLKKLILKRSISDTNLQIYDKGRIFDTMYYVFKFSNNLDLIKYYIECEKNKISKLTSPGENEKKEKLSNALDTYIQQSIGAKKGGKELLTRNVDIFKYLINKQTNFFKLDEFKENLLNSAKNNVAYNLEIIKYLFDTNDKKAIYKLYAKYNSTINEDQALKIYKSYLPEMLKATKQAAIDDKAFDVILYLQDKIHFTDNDLLTMSLFGNNSTVKEVIRDELNKRKTNSNSLRKINNLKELVNKMIDNSIQNDQNELLSLLIKDDFLKDKMGLKEKIGNTGSIEVMELLINHCKLTKNFVLKSSFKNEEFFSDTIYDYLIEKYKLNFNNVLTLIKDTSNLKVFNILLEKELNMDDNLSILDLTEDMLKSKEISRKNKQTLKSKIIPKIINKIALQKAKLFAATDNKTDIYFTDFELDLYVNDYFSSYKNYKTIIDFELNNEIKKNGYSSKAKNLLNKIIKVSFVLSKFDFAVKLIEKHKLEQKIILNNLIHIKKSTDLDFIIDKYNLPKDSVINVLANNLEHNYDYIVKKYNIEASDLIKTIKNKENYNEILYSMSSLTEDTTQLQKIYDILVLEKENLKKESPTSDLLETLTDVISELDSKLIAYNNKRISLGRKKT